MKSLANRLDKLEQRVHHKGERGRRVERYTIDGIEHVQLYWNGVVDGKPWLAELYDAWPEPNETEEST